MFVSSYNTYIHTTASDKAAKERFEKQDFKSDSFSSKFLKENPSVVFKNSTLPIDYTYKSNFFSNKQKIDSQKQQFEEPFGKEFSKTNENLNRYVGQNTLANAKSAYESNSKMFSLFLKPHVALDQTPKIDKKLPPKAQEAKEHNLRYEMVNTYIQNDIYYKITA